MNRQLMRLTVAIPAVMLLVCGPSTRAQEKEPTDSGSGGSSAMTGKGGAYLHTRRILGTVTTEGGRIMFVSRVDKLTWTIMNPETLKGLEGQTVRIVGHIYRDTNSIHVVEVMTFRIAGSPASR